MAGRTLSLAIALLILPGGMALAQTLLFASERWAAIDRGNGLCEASTVALRTVSGEGQPRAGLAFDARGPRNGQFFARLRQPARPGSPVMLKIGSRPFLLVSRGTWAWSRDPRQDEAIATALRSDQAMRIEARSESGRRFVDYYLTGGAATAIDSAAARCASQALAKSARPN